MKFIIHTDGGARGNPGPAAIGVVIEEITSSKGQETKKILSEFGKRIGETTNNVAEYSAIIEALTEVKILSRSEISLRERISKFKSEYRKKTTIQFYLDSTLVVNQLNGNFKVKDVKLRELLLQVRMMEQEIGGDIRYEYVPREQNRRSDLFVNKALDE